MKLILAFLFLGFTNVFSQKFDTEIIIEKKSVFPVDDLHAIPIGDSLFLSFNERSNYKNSTSQRQFFVLPNGEIREVELDELTNKFICGVKVLGEKHFFYFLNEKSKKKIQLSTLVFDSRTNKKRIDSTQIEINGKLIFSYVEKDLFLFYAVKGEWLLHKIQISGSQIISDQTYKMPIDLADDKSLSIGSNIGFYDAEAPIDLDQMKNDIKIIKNKELVSITIDRRTTFENEIPKTIIHKINLVTSETSTKIISDFESSSFSSFLLEDYLIKFVDKNEIIVVDLKSSKSVMKLSLNKKNFSLTEPSFLRDGNKKLTKEVTLSTFFKAPGKISISPSLNLDKSIRILVQKSYEKRPFVPVLGMFGVATQLALAALNFAVKTIGEHPSVDNYFYVKQEDNSLIYDRESTSNQKSIDKYEIESLKRGDKYLFRGYLNIKSGYFCFYQKNKSRNLHVVKF